MVSITINTDEIPKSGLKLKKEINASEGDLNSDEIIFLQPIRIEAKIEKIRNEVIAKVSLSAIVKMRCARCLEWYETKEDKEFTRSYEVPQNRQIDLWRDLREDLILDYPMKPLCSKDCKGLCQFCGQNLNEGSCPHQSKN
jgi:uncharacterized protein